MQGLGKCSIPTDRGFTLVELMVVVGLIALVMTQGIPWLESTTLNSRRAAQINAFVADLNAARGLAVAGDDVTFGVHGINPCTGCEVSLCKTEDGATCSTSSSVYWENGWLLFWDADGDGVVDTVDNDRLIAVRPALTGGNTLRGNLLVRHRVTYTTSGFTSNNESLAWCDKRGFGDQARAIVIASTGRVRTAAINDASVSLVNCSP